MPSPLRPHPRQPLPRGPVVLVVMDGIGRGAGDEADAVAIASTPTLDRLWVPGVRAELRAHGKAVGLPSDDDMGNSEVGHNALGAGKVYAQGALLVGRAITSGALFQGEVWRDVVARGARGGAIHFLGLLSDGNVHSHVSHLEALLTAANRSGAQRQITRDRYEADWAMVERGWHTHVLADARQFPSATAAIEALRGEHPG